MRLTLTEHPDGVETAPGRRVVYDVGADAASFGAARVEGHALVWDLDGASGGSTLLEAEVDLDEGRDWVMRCDRVDFPPGAVAHLHTHPGPGIRCQIMGRLRVATGGESHVYRPFEAWFEPGPTPVLAEAVGQDPAAFVRVMLLPSEWAGKRTIRYLDPENPSRPRLQRARVFLEQRVAPP